MNEGVALTCGHDPSVGELVDLLVNVLLGALCRSNSGLGKLHVNADTSHVDGRVQHLELTLLGCAIESGELLIDLAHGLNIESAVVHELRPFLGVSLACCAVELPSRGERLAENLNESAAVCVLGLVSRQMEHLAEFFQRTGEACLIGHDHSVVERFHWKLDLGHDIREEHAVEHDAVLPHVTALFACYFVKYLSEFLGHGARSNVPHFGGCVVDCISPQENFSAGVCGIGVGTGANIFRRERF